MKTKTENKLGNLKLEVIRFNSADVIVTSAISPVMLSAGTYEFMSNFTIAQNHTVPNTTYSIYNEPTNGQ